MKVLLRGTKTGLYYVGPNEWTADAKQALDFDEVEKAVQLNRKEQLADMEVVLSFDDPTATPCWRFQSIASRAIGKQQPGQNQLCHVARPPKVTANAERRDFSPAICYGLRHEFETCSGGRRWAGGFFAAITCAQTAPDVEVTLLEKGPQFLSKVRISGGGRCNVTHACFQAREFAAYYPRGEQALIAPLNSFQASDTVAWFEAGA